MTFKRYFIWPTGGTYGESSGTQQEGYTYDGQEKQGDPQEHLFISRYRIVGHPVSDQWHLWLGRSEYVDPDLAARESILFIWARGEGYKILPEDMARDPVPAGHPELYGRQHA